MDFCTFAFVSLSASLITRLTENKASLVILAMSVYLLNCVAVGTDGSVAAKIVCGLFQCKIKC